jgi:Tol biopolymer transport system component
MRYLPKLALPLLLALLACTDGSIGRTRSSLKDVFVANKIQKIAFSVSQWKFGFGHGLIHEIYALTVNNPSAKLIQPENSSNPAWSPDGSGIIFTSNRDGNAAIYSVELRGLAVRTLMRSDKYGLYAPTISPDGRVLVCDLISGSGPGELGLPSLGGAEQPSIAIITLDGTNSKTVYVAQGGVNASVVWKR